MLLRAAGIARKLGRLGGQNAGKLGPGKQTVGLGGTGRGTRAIARSQRDHAI